MKVYHGKYVVPGLAAFLVIITFPMWSSVLTRKPSFVNDATPQAGQPDKCILDDAKEMRAIHMQILNRWRDEVVRDGDRMRSGQEDGENWLEQYPLKSLTRTCMACHGQADENGQSTTKATYCLHCHNYVNVTVYCWDCHVNPADPALAKKTASAKEAE